MRAPHVCANLDMSANANMQAYVRPSVVLDVAGHKVGVIGYVTSDTAVRRGKSDTVLGRPAHPCTTTYSCSKSWRCSFLPGTLKPSQNLQAKFKTSNPVAQLLAKPVKVKFLDEIAAVRVEAERLHQQGVKILIALGHSGYLKDKEIAAQVPHVDLVVGGHSHSFLWTGAHTPWTQAPLLCTAKKSRHGAWLVDSPAMQCKFTGLPTVGPRAARALVPDWAMFVPSLPQAPSQTSTSPWACTRRS